MRLSSVAASFLLLLPLVSTEALPALDPCWRRCFTPKLACNDGDWPCKLFQEEADPQSPSRWTDCLRFLSQSSSKLPPHRNDSLHPPNLYRQPSFRPYRPPHTIHREMSKAPSSRHPGQCQRPSDSRYCILRDSRPYCWRCSCYKTRSRNHIGKSQRHHDDVHWHRHQRQWGPGDLHSARPCRLDRDNLRESGHED